MTNGALLKNAACHHNASNLCATRENSTLQAVEAEEWKYEGANCAFDNGTQL